MKTLCRWVIPIFVGSLLAVGSVLSVTGIAQDDPADSARVERLEAKVDRLEARVIEAEKQAVFAGVIVFFLFGVVLALWAQRTGQSGCLWFIVGVIPCVNILAALIALSSGPRRRRRRAVPADGRSYPSGPS